MTPRETDRAMRLLRPHAFLRRIRRPLVKETTILVLWDVGQRATGLRFSEPDEVVSSLDQARELVARRQR